MTIHADNSKSLDFSIILFSKENLSDRERGAHSSLVFSNSVRIKEWFQTRIANPNEIEQITLLSPTVKERYKDFWRTNHLISMMGAGFISVFHLQTSYLVKTAVSVVLIASVAICDKFAKAAESNRLNYMEAVLIKKSLVYLKDPNQANKHLKDSKQYLSYKNDELKNLEKNLNGKLDEQALSNKKNELTREIAITTEDVKSLEESNTFFQDNLDLVTRVTNAFLEINEAAKNKMEACEGFIFSFLGNVILTRCVFSLIKVVVNPNNYRIMGAGLTAMVGGIGIAITFVAIGAFIMSVQNALIIIAHRHDEAKKQSLLASIKEEQKNIKEEQKNDPLIL